jgi:hypothetical protein
MRLLLPLFCVIAAAITPNAFAYNGSISFSQGERLTHERNVSRIVEDAAACLQADLNRHKQFVGKYGISAFYGENATFAKTTSVDPWSGKEVSSPTSSEQKRDMLRARGLPENLVQQFVPQRACRSSSDCPLKLEPTSCIGLTLKCLARGFNNAGETAVWNRLRAFVRNNGVQGDALQFALQQLGWKLVYWNPATDRASAWDAAERQAYPGNPKGIWGKHALMLSQIRSQNRYYTNRMDDTRSMVDFGTTTPDFIKRTPYFVGIAHMGYHVFAGSYGQIVEGHSTRAITDPQAIETSAFNPLVKGGGPRGGPYKSGVVAVPPGYLR